MNSAGVDAGARVQALALEGANLDAVIALVRTHTGIAMTERKRALLEARLGPRLRALGLTSYEQYLARLQGSAAASVEVQQFINVVTTNDTVFFRTPAVWQYFSEQFLPDWLAHKGSARLRIWSAAAASGEEAWSIAMLCQQFQQRHPAFRYQIAGSDIDTTMVAACRAGSYRGRSAQQLRLSHPALVARYFDDDGAGLSVRPELSAKVQFSQHNLLAALTPDQQFDLVFLRNVLIYFDEPCQRGVLARVRQQMAADAVLLLGEQESITRLGTPFVFTQQHVYGRGHD